MLKIYEYTNTVTLLVRKCSEKVNAGQLGTGELKSKEVTLHEVATLQRETRAEMKQINSGRCYIDVILIKKKKKKWSETNQIIELL